MPEPAPPIEGILRDVALRAGPQADCLLLSGSFRIQDAGRFSAPRGLRDRRPKRAPGLSGGRDGKRQRRSARHDPRPRRPRPAALRPLDPPRRSRRLAIAARRTRHRAGWRISMAARRGQPLFPRSRRRGRRTGDAGALVVKRWKVRAHRIPPARSPVDRGGLSPDR